MLIEAAPTTEFWSAQNNKAINADALTLMLI